MLTDFISREWHTLARADRAAAIIRTPVPGAPTRADDAARFAEAGFSGDAVERLAEMGGRERHAARVASIPALVRRQIEMAALYWADVTDDGETDWPACQSGISPGRMDDLIRAACVLDRYAESSRRYRPLPLQGLGKGRFNATDGAAWTAAIEEVGVHGAVYLDGPSVDPSLVVAFGDTRYDETHAVPIERWWAGGEIIDRLADMVLRRAADRHRRGDRSFPWLNRERVGGVRYPTPAEASALYSNVRNDAARDAAFLAADDARSEAPVLATEDAA